MESVALCKGCGTGPPPGRKTRVLGSLIWARLWSLLQEQSSTKLQSHKEAKLQPSHQALSCCLFLPSTASILNCSLIASLSPLSIAVVLLPPPWTKVYLENEDNSPGWEVTFQSEHGIMHHTASSEPNFSFHD